jgi:uncharacterized surface protein with fasciclin (FAS1) repeats
MKKAAFAIALLWIYGCSNDTSDPTTEVGSTIVEIAAADGRFDTLAAAIDRADLRGALSSEGPFTVFAPTDDAFARLPAGVMDSISKEQLAQILTYHVIGDRVTSTMAATASSAPTLQGSDIAISSMDGKIYINGITLVMSADIEADNGIIHVIDSVIFPADMVFPGTIVDAAIAYPRLSSLVDAVTNADPAVASTLGGAGTFTLFAPINSAFDGIDTSADLTPVLLYHALDTAADSSTVVSLVGSDVTTLSGSTVSVMAGPSLVDGSGNTRNVVHVDVRTSNGIIHVIDGVLIPE